MTEHSYTLWNHRHRFAAWAACRAAQRGFATVDVLRRALDASDLPSYVQTSGEAPVTPDLFDKKHTAWCGSILDRLDSAPIRQRATYGRAAKLVAVYIKSMVIVGPSAMTELAFNAHPPVDRLLLQSLARSIAREHPSVAALARNTSWTQLDEDHYFQLIAALRSLLRPEEAFWSLERYWNIHAPARTSPPDHRA